MQARNITENPPHNPEMSLSGRASQGRHALRHMRPDAVN